MKTIICISLLMCLVGCNKANISNPVKNYKSLEDINKESGGNLFKPNYEGIEDIAYLIIEGEDLVAEYDFKLEDVEYAFRFSKAPFNRDISGWYLGQEPAFSENDYGLAFVNPKSGVRLARWKAEDDSQYVLIAEGEIEQNRFVEFVYEISEVIGVKEREIEKPSKSNFTMEVEEEGDNVICYTYPIEDAASSPVTRVTYICEGEKINKVIADSIYGSNELAKTAYEELLTIYSKDEIELKDNIITTVLNKYGYSIEELSRTKLLMNLNSSVTMLEE